MIALALAAALAAAEPAGAAPPVVHRRCRDEYARDLCDPAVRAAIRAKTGAESAEALVDQGYVGVRVFLVDGYSNDMPVVSVLSRDEGAPVMQVRVRVAGRPPVVADIKPDSWTIEVAALLKRMGLAAPEWEPSTAEAQPQAKPGDPPPPIAICLHPWMAIVEILDQGGVTSRIRTACGDQPIFQAGFYLSQLALHQQAGCGALAEDQYRNDSARLVGCATLVGRDRWSAVWLRNRFGDHVLQYPRAENAAQVAEFFAPDVSFKWSGEPDREGREAVQFWIGTERASVMLVATEVEATPEGGEVRGVAVRRSGGGERAPFVQTWRMFKDGRLRMTAWTMGAFKPESPN